MYYVSGAASAADDARACEKGEHANVLHDGFEFDEADGTIAHDFRVVAGFAHVAHARGDDG